MEEWPERRKASAYTGQHRKRRTDIHALSGFRAHDPRIQPAKNHALDSAVTKIKMFTF